ncbi:MAG: HDOD domain-containing protein [Planctomycetaceae bacterium]
MSSRHIAVILFNEESRAAAVAEELRPIGVEVRIAASTDDFRRVLNKQRVDVVVVQNDLEGFLSGVEVLERVYGDLLRPRTVLAGSLTSEMQGRAANVGVDRVVPGDATPRQLREAVEQLLGDDSQAQSNIPAKARLIVRDTEFKPLPQLMTRLCLYLDHQTASMQGLADDISVDPKVTAELLKLTNSAAFGFRTKVDSVFDAVRLLGIRRTVGLILSVNMVRSQAELSRALPPDVQQWYNSRSVLIASTASAFAKNLANVSADTAYVLGLLQDIGVLVLARHHGGRYLGLLNRARKAAPLRLDVCELQEFEVHHAHVSAALLQKWQLPQSLISLVLAHHDAAAADRERAEVEERFLHVMRIGEAVANMADNSAPQRHHAFHAHLARYGGMSATVAQCLAEAVAKTVESSALFSLPAPDPEAIGRLLKEVAQEPQESPAEADDPPEAPTAAETPPSPSSRTFAASANPSSPAARPPRGDAPRNTAAEPPASMPLPQRTRRRILVVEDDITVVRTIERMLAEFDVAVDFAAEGADARQHAILADAVLCDVHLTAERGVELVRSLRRARYARPIIMISGDRSRATVMACLEAGADDYLVKPFDKSALVEKLRRRGVPIASHREPVGA